MIAENFSKPPVIPYVLLDAFEPNVSGMYTKFYLNHKGDLYTTASSISTGTWYINGAYIAR